MPLIDDDANLRPLKRYVERDTIVLSRSKSNRTQGLACRTIRRLRRPRPTYMYVQGSYFIELSVLCVVCCDTIGCRHIIIIATIHAHAIMAHAYIHVAWARHACTGARSRVQQLLMPAQFMATKKERKNLTYTGRKGGKIWQQSKKRATSKMRSKMRSKHYPNCRSTIVHSTPLYSSSSR